MRNNQIFIDSSYILALISPRDQWHAKAVEWQAGIAAANRPLLTIQFVLAEIADSLAAVKFRRQAAQVIRTLETNDSVEIVPAASELFATSLNFYENRQDKNWGFTDCSSFVVMAERNLTDALTVDDDFRQAGFHALLFDGDL